MRVLAPLLLIAIVAVVFIVFRYGAQVRKSRNTIRDLARSNPQALLLAMSQDARLNRQVDADVVKLIIEQSDKINQLERKIEEGKEIATSLLNESRSYELGGHYGLLTSWAKDSQPLP